MAEKSSVTLWPPCETRSEACPARWAAALIRCATSKALMLYKGGNDLRVEHAGLDIDCRAEGIGKVLGVV